VLYVQNELVAYKCILMYDNSVDETMMTFCLMTLNKIGDSSSDDLIYLTVSLKKQRHLLKMTSH